MEDILSHLPQILIVLGLILLAIEVLVLGFSTFVLFFIGIGTIVTGIVMSTGLLPATLLNSLLATAIISTIVAFFSWQPMKRMQSNTESNQVKNDIIGHQFVLSDDLAIGKTVTHRFSGINWQVKSKEVLLSGTNVKIVSMEVGLLTVERIK